MNRISKTRIIAMLMSVAMLLTLLPVGLAADEPAVAKIGDNEYATLDAAIETANDGDTIELLADCTATKTFYKSLTFTGGHTVSMDFYGWRYNGDLTFDGANLIINSDSNSPVANNGESARWFTMVLGGSITAKNNANITFMFDSDSGTNCAIYAGSGGVTINVDNKSAFSIYGKNTKGVSGQGIQLDSTANTGIFVTGDSSFLIDGTNRGYVNSPTIYVDDSTFTVQNCTSNASNGGTFTAIESNINFLNNAGHGLSAGDLSIDDSTVNAIGNGANGIHTTGTLVITNKSVVDIEDNACSISSKWTIPGALFVAGRSLIENSTLTIRNNKGSGIYQKANSLTIADSADVTIMNNKAEKLGIGGGIYVNGTAVLGKNVKLYNNHAATIADDIYCSENGTITFGDVGNNWVLDDCTPNHIIDGWYEDGNNDKGTRWTAHAENPDNNYIKLTNSGTYSGLLALKAAHGVNAVEPEDIDEPDEPGPIWPTFTMATVIKVDSEDENIRLSGAKFELYREGRATPIGLNVDTTDENGELRLPSLTPGSTYYLVEVAAPEGYMLTSEPIVFTAEYDMRQNVIYVTNTKSKTPSDLNSDDHFAYIVGYPDGNVRPTGNITRAEVATIFFRLLTEEVRNENMTWDNPFSDVNKGDWFDCAISTLYAMGIINGYPDGTYDPNGFITRAEFAAIAARFDTIGNDFEQSFGDVYGHWAEDEIAAAKAHGWLTGYEDGTFKPDQLITRAEAMTIVNRVLNRIPESADALLDDMVKWPDNADTSAWYYLAVQEATNSHFYDRTDSNKEIWTEIREPRDWTELEK